MVSTCGFWRTLQTLQICCHHFNKSDVRTATSVQTIDFSTLYTSLLPNLLKSRINNLVHNAFRKKDGSVKYTHIKTTRSKGYFTHDINGGGDNMYTADNICKMIEFLIDNIFVQLGGCFFSSGNWNSSGNEMCSITC